MQQTNPSWTRRAFLLSILLVVFLAACTSSTPPAGHTGQTPPGVYVASLTAGKAAYTYTQTVSALSADNGQARWNAPLETADLIGHWGAPVISKGVVYATSAHAIDASYAEGALSAISAQDGHVLWHTEIGVAASDPLIQDGAVYISALVLPDPNDHSTGLKRSVFALNERDGSIRWHTTITGTFAKLAWNGGTVYSISNDWCFDYCSSGASVAAINASTGALLWNKEITEAYHLSLPQFVNGTLYFSTYDYHVSPGSIPGAAVLAVSSQDGSVRWLVPVLSASADGPPPVIANGMIYVDLATIPDPSYPNRGTYSLAALSLDNGKVVWQSRTDTYPSPPVLADGVLYLTSTVTPCDSATCYSYFASAFSAQDGKRLWRVQTDRLPSTPVVANGRVYVLIWHLPAEGTASRPPFSLVALDARTGASLWQVASLDHDPKVPPETASIAAITGGIIYVTLGGIHAGPAMLIALHEQNGAAEWTWKTAGFIGGVTVIS